MLVIIFHISDECRVYLHSISWKFIVAFKKLSIYIYIYIYNSHNVAVEVREFRWNFWIDFAKTNKSAPSACVCVYVFELGNQIKFHFNFGLKTLTNRSVTKQWLNSTASIMHYTYTIVVQHVCVCVLITFLFPFVFVCFFCAAWLLGKKSSLAIYIQCPHLSITMREMCFSGFSASLCSHAEWLNIEE